MLVASSFEQVRESSRPIRSAERREGRTGKAQRTKRRSHGNTRNRSPANRP